MSEPYKIIDFHTHSFPEGIAYRAVHKLSHTGNLKNYTNGTIGDLTSSMKHGNISLSVLMPVVTKPEQQESINSIAIQVNSHTESTGLISFGGLHPENYDYKDIIDRLWKLNFKGIKFHPVYQDTPIDDTLYLKIIDYALSKDLYITIHAGKDISMPANGYASVKRLRTLVKEFNSDKIILAHMGGWDEWDEAEEYLVGSNVIFDTAFCLNPIRPSEYLDLSSDTNISNASARCNSQDMPKYQNLHPENNNIRPLLSSEQFVRMVRNHGVDKIIFGSDSPWSEQVESVELIRNSGLTPEEQKQIMCDNPARILGL